MNSTRRAIATWRGRMLLLRSYATTALINNTSASEVMNPIRSSIATWRDRALLSRSSSSSRISYYSSAALMINNDSESSSGSGSEGPSSPQAQPLLFPRVPLPEPVFGDAVTGGLVNLGGYVDFPVLSGVSSSGNFWAGTVICRDVDTAIRRDDHSYPHQKDPQPIWMPVLFQNDWAWTAASHLKKNDKIYIVGQFVNLNANPPVPVCAPLCRGNVQVLADGFAILEKSLMEEETLKHSGDESSWKHLLANPGEWKDNRVDKKDEEAPDFFHTDTRNALWLSSSPDWVKSVLPLIPPVNFRRVDPLDP